MVEVGMQEAGLFLRLRMIRELQLPLEAIAGNRVMGGVACPKIEIQGGAERVLLVKPSSVKELVLSVVSFPQAVEKSFTVLGIDANPTWFCQWDLRSTIVRKVTRAKAILIALVAFGNGRRVHLRFLSSAEKHTKNTLI